MFNLQKVDEHSKNPHKWKFLNEIVNFFVLGRCSKPIICLKVAQKGKTCSRLLEPQKIAPTVAEHNRDSLTATPENTSHRRTDRGAGESPPPPKKKIGATQGMFLERREIWANALRSHWQKVARTLMTLVDEEHVKTS